MTTTEGPIGLARDDLDVGCVGHDVPAMLRFYGEVLGFPARTPMPVPGIGVMHAFRVGSNLVKVVEAENPPGPPANPGGMPWEASGLRYLTVHVTDLDAVLARIEAAGMSTGSGVVQPVPGIRYAIVHDPDGNGVEFVEGA